MGDDLKEFANILFAPSERDMYKARIDKAIDYLKSDNYWVSQVKANDYLLDILKGNDTNE